MSVDTAVHTALSDILNGALSVPVYDPAPGGATMPYVVMDGQKMESAEALDTRVDTVTATVTVWSDATGQAEALGIMAQIYDALHKTSPALGEGRAVWATVPVRDLAWDADSSAYKGTVTIQIVTEPA